MARAGPPPPSPPAPQPPSPAAPQDGLREAGLPLRNSWVGGSRSQQPGGVGTLGSHRSVAWKAFFRTWGGRGCRPGGETLPRPPCARAPAPAPALGVRWAVGGHTGSVSRSPSFRKQRGLQMRERRGGQRQPRQDLSPGDTQFLPKTRELQGASASSPGTWGLAHSHCCSGRVWKSLGPRQGPAQPRGYENGCVCRNTRHRRRVPWLWATSPARTVRSPPLLPPSLPSAQHPLHLARPGRTRSRLPLGTSLGSDWPGRRPAGHPSSAPLPPPQACTPACTVGLESGLWR